MSVLVDAESAEADTRLSAKAAMMNQEELLEDSDVEGQEAEADETNEKDGSEFDGVPYDRGWAWAVVFGCFINYALYNGYVKCYSLFYVELLHRFHANATETALFFSMRSAVLSISSLFVMNIVVGNVGARRTVVAGGILMSLSGILPSFTNNLMAIICLQGICLGMGQSMIASPGEVLMGAYFQQRRNLAFPLAKCGGSVGAILMPLLVSLFLQTYSLSGALLLTGALCMHGIVAGLLFRPISFYTKRRAKQLPSKRALPESEKTVEENPETTLALIKEDLDPKDGKIVFDLYVRKGSDRREECECTEDRPLEPLDQPEKKNRSSKRRKASRFLLDFSLFRRPLFRLMLGYFLLFSSANIMISYLSALASEQGVTDSENGVLLSVVGGLDLVCRILCALIAHCGVLRVPTMIIISYAILGVTSQFVRFLTSFYHFLALSVLLGLVGGVANATLPVLVLEFVGLEHMAKALGFVMLAIGASSAGSFPLLGYIRDVTGSYVAVYHVIGAAAILAAVLLCCEKCVRRLEKNPDV